VGALLSSLLPAVCAAKSAADYFVHSLPGAPEGKPLVKMHAGHIEVTPEHHGNREYTSHVLDLLLTSS
jgi:carboxypeptidase D